MAKRRYCKKRGGQNVAKSINVAKAINEVHPESKDMEEKEHFNRADFIKPELDIFQPPLAQNQIIKGNCIDTYHKYTLQYWSIRV